MSSPRSTSGTPAWPRKHDTIGLPPAASAARADRAGYVLGAGDQRRHEDRDHRVDRGVGESKAERVLVLARGCAGDEVDGIADRRARRCDLAHRVLGGLGQLGHLEAGAGARVGGEDTRATGVADDRDAPTGGQRLVRQHHRGREQLVERVDTDHARLAEQRVDRDVGCGESRGVR